MSPPDLYPAYRRADLPRKLDTAMQTIDPFFVERDFSKMTVYRHDTSPGGLQPSGTGSESSLAGKETDQWKLS